MWISFGNNYGKCRAYAKQYGRVAYKIHAIFKPNFHPIYAKKTRQTETSKYPKEKKSTELPWVVASESGLWNNKFPENQSCYLSTKTSCLSLLSK